MTTPRYYTATDLPSQTGFTLSNLLWLEHLGVLPSSACAPEQGRTWPADEVDQWVEFLKEPGVREWVETLLPTPDGDKPTPVDLPGSEE